MPTPRSAPLPNWQTVIFQPSGATPGGNGPTITTPSGKWWHWCGGYLKVESPVAGAWNLYLYDAAQPDTSRTRLIATAQLGAAGTSQGMLTPSPRFALPPSTPLTPFFLDLYGASSYQLVLWFLETTYPLTVWS